MKRYLALVIVAISALLSGCATTFDSEVTAFHAWPADLQDKTYVFAPAKTQENSLEYSNYEQLIRAELQRLGFSEQPQSAKLKVSFSYGVQTDTVIITQPAYDPFWYGPPGYPGWRRMGGYPFYDPFWYGPPQQTSFPVYNRQLHLSIANRADGRKLYEVRVESDGRQAGLAAAMPYMVRSAFADFPGPSGVVREIRLKLNDRQSAAAPAAPVPASAPTPAPVAKP